MEEHLPRDIWPAYLDGALDPSQQASAERHLAVCSACRAQLSAHQALRHRLRRLAAPSSSPAMAAATERAWYHVRSHRQRRTFPLLRLLRGLVYGVGAAAALALLAVGLAALLSQQVEPTTSGRGALPAGPATPFTLTLTLDAAYATAYSDLPGDAVPVLYTLELHNDGPGVASNVRVTATVPASLTYLEGSVTGDGVYVPETNAIIWDDSLGPGETHGLAFVCGVPDTFRGPGVPITNLVTVDDGLNPPFTRSLTVNFTPWPTIVPTDGPAPTRTPWVTPTPFEMLAATATPWTPSPLPFTPTPWVTPTPPVPPPPSSTPSPPGFGPPGSPTPTPTPLPLTVSPTPADPPIATPTPWVPGLPTITSADPDVPTLTPTPWISPTPLDPAATPTPWVSPTSPGSPQPPTPPTLSSTPTPVPTPTGTPGPP